MRVVPIQIQLYLLNSEKVSDIAWDQLQNVAVVPLYMKLMNFLV